MSHHLPFQPLFRLGSLDMSFSFVRCRDDVAKPPGGFLTALDDGRSVVAFSMWLELWLHSPGASIKWNSSPQRASFSALIQLWDVFIWYRDGIVFACLCLCFTTDIEICWPPGTPLSGNADIQNREQWHRYSHNVHRIMKVYSGGVSVFQRFSRFLSASSGATFLIYRSVASTTQQMRLAFPLSGQQEKVTTTTIIVNQKSSCLQGRR